MEDILIKSVPMVFDLYDDSGVDFVRRYNDIDRFVRDFRKKYEYIIAYHGTNINETDASLIKAEGLKRASIKMLKKRAIDRFVLTTDNDVLQDKILTVIEEQFKTKNFITIGEINFTIEKEQLQDRAYQYLLFGPESLIPIADELRKTCYLNFRRRMMDYGTPTIIKAEIPVSNTGDYWISGIHGYLKGAGGECCLVYRKDLPKENIKELLSVPRPRDLYGFEWL